MSRLVVISGSPTPGSRLNGIIEFVENIWLERGIGIQHIRVAELSAEALIQAQFNHPDIVQASALVEKADAVVVASPVFKASYTGVLKTFLDLLPQTGLKGKVTLPLFIGGSLAHLLSIDYAMQPVLNALGSRQVLVGVYAVDQWIERLEQGGHKLTSELEARLTFAAVQLAEELEWLQKRKVESSEA